MADDAYRRPYHTEARMAAEDGSPAGPCRVLVAGGKLAPGLARMPNVRMPVESAWGRPSYGAQVKHPRAPSGFGLDHLTDEQRRKLGAKGGRAKATRMKVG